MTRLLIQAALFAKLHASLGEHIVNRCGPIERPVHLDPILTVQYAINQLRKRCIITQLIL
jgi:hypothetical protein